MTIGEGDDLVPPLFLPRDGVKTPRDEVATGIGNPIALNSAAVGDGGIFRMELGMKV